MSILKHNDKQIEEAAELMKLWILGMAKSEKVKRDILEEIDRLEQGLKAINHMTGGAIGPWLRDLFGMKNLY